MLLSVPPGVTTWTVPVVAPTGTVVIIRDGDLTVNVADVPLSVAIRAGDILVATARPEGISARNTFQGKLVSLDRRGVTVIAIVDAGVRFEVHLTPSAIQSLRLEAGQQVWLIVKTYSCHLVAVD